MELLYLKYCVVVAKSFSRERLVIFISLSPWPHEQVIVTDQRGSGESFKRFGAKAGDLYLADHAHGVRPGIFYLREPGADVLVRFADNLPLQDAVGGRWDLLKHLRRLGSTQVDDWPEWREVKGGLGSFFAPKVA